jgi:hypothetical protein
MDGVSALAAAGAPPYRRARTTYRKGRGMLRRKLLVVVMALGLLVITALPAHAWDLVHEKTGYGRVTLRAWTQNYNQVAFVADHAGTRISVEVTIDCRSGYFFNNTWSDGGGRFRYVHTGLGNENRCNHVFKVIARSAIPDLNLTLWARG